MKCPVCAAENPTGARFCTSCGTFVAGENRGQGIGLAAIANPFLKIKARSLLLWVVIGIPILILGYVLAGSSLDSAGEDLDPFIDELIFSAVFYGVLIGWAIWVTVKHRVDFGLLIGRIPTPYKWRSVVSTVLVLIVFSISTFWLILYWLALNAPDVAEFAAGGELYATSEYTDYPGLYNAQIFVVTVFVAPVVEEFVFRGVLLTRWAAKWGPTVGILLSSIVFGVGHDADFVGAFVFGIVMSLMYMSTRTLIIPMVAHLLNNLIANGLEAITLTLDTAEGIDTVAPASLIEDLESGIEFAVVGAAVTVPLLAWYIIRHWPHGGRNVPYFSPTV